MAYIAPPAKEIDYGSLSLKAGTGGVTEYTFVAVDADAGTATTATSGAFNVGIVQETASAGAQCTVKLLGLSLLSVNGGTAIAVGDGLDPTTGGVGIKAAADKDEINAVALMAATTTTRILVRLGGAFSLSHA